ncbi:MAG: cell division protein [Massilia sp.]
MKPATMRLWAVRWVYAGAAVHMLVGLLLPWLVQLVLLDHYFSAIDTVFWGGAAPAAARAQQQWWVSLFGPTVQTVAVWMAALAVIADRERSSFAWGSLIVGILVWAPQDIAISLRAACWANVWLDCVAVLTTVPPLAWLFLHDRRGTAARTAAAAR